ncbi:MAG: hypothetical protein LIO65_06685 [Odoribacter sp.]|nr:hypothetical protein [Odoribacter sp.]
MKNIFIIIILFLCSGVATAQKLGEEDFQKHLGRLNSDLNNSIQSKNYKEGEKGYLKFFG